MIAENLKGILHAIDEASKRSPYGEAVELVVVTKKHSPEEVCEVLKALPDVHLGENRVQEWQEKYEALHTLAPDWEIIGHLQTNKVNKVVGAVAMIQSVDSLHLAEAIAKAAQKKGVVQKVLVQVNMAGETQKYGIAPEGVRDLLASCTKLEGIAVEGLMFIAPNLENKDDVRPYFKQMRTLYDALRKEGYPLTKLSMGMSGDYIEAIEEGANVVRIGSAVFEA